MGSTASKLVRPGEVSSPVQRDHLICCQLCCLPGHSSIALFNEPASFNEPKPYGLSVTDDTWASLKLRVDPLARHILDPHRSYVGAAFLALFVAAVFTAVRPGWHIVDLSSYYDKQNQANDANYDYYAGGGGGDGSNYYYDGNNNNNNNNNGGPSGDEDDDVLDTFYARERDDDYYNNDGIDDIVLAELEYRNEELVHASIFWRIGFIAALSILFLATVTVAVGMELKNARYDAKIHAVIAEMRERFEAEGYEIGYRTRTEISGVLFGHLRPQRAIVFRRKDAGGPYHPPVPSGVPTPATSTLRRGPEGGPTADPSPTVPSPSDGISGSHNLQNVSNFGGIGGVGGRSTIGGEGRYAKTVKAAQKTGGDIVFVQVPEGRRPGELLTVLTPSGNQIMVAIPPRTRPGQSFPVLVPPKPTGGGPALSPVCSEGEYDVDGGLSSGGIGSSGSGPSPSSTLRHREPREFELSKFV
mmetsp:Transcript_15393/g.33476  ORF Transcript_15393/g.33476 Transcript_15393/m.33476 type:complete len:471 (-) Transcript_15393:496-1908(-)|eukprot:CAMPEP_0178486724 /NCGR_PEP_ID=MMETSP0696-20121128/8953_1 /TAXON_ID=265572 /ORGANISM="Extubocellulus spinifer, Strain CCMP396" /LENGTH=470 /DNA_ID=CAMNT_0020114393 /DNA_START=289 /DNA_END=1701 /DNA_ORIENTATION=+